MSDRLIYCQKCKQYLGVVRDGKLRIGITFRCRECSQPAKPLDLPTEFQELFQGIRR